MSTYNFRMYEDLDSTFQTFLNDSKKSLGIPDKIDYHSSNHEVYKHFKSDISRSYAAEVRVLLEQNVRVLIYNGQDDFVVNTPGVLNYINGLNWEGIPQWKRTRKDIWTIHGKVSGWAKVYRCLLYTSPSPRDLSTSRMPSSA